ncbi:MAG TPA: protein kinase [Gemmatimonadales bacterium]|nr:protein kinase [Gemmatimonadales bacterium]
MNDFAARLQAALGSAYQIGRELGGGGMSRVFLAVETALDRQVVIKVLPPELGAGFNVERFRREIQLAAKLQHPHIVPVLAAGAADGLLFYTMPFIEGESLRARLTRQGELPIAEGVRILVDVADALAYAHAHGLVHRDIKPDNVLLSGKHALVTDFGVSKALSSATGPASLTSVGVALGTPAYMAPEQAAADPSTDHRADIYALGIVAYEILTGHAPFSAGSAQQLLAAHVAQPPPPLTGSRPAVPPSLETLVLRCLEKRPADRPQSAADVLGALEGMATPSAGTPPVVAPAARGGRPRWLAAAAAAAVAVAAVALFLTRGGGLKAEATRSIAVLPFETLGGGDAAQALADGLQDDILTQLTKIGALQVTSRSSVQEYRKARKPVREIGRELGVRALLEGQVQRTETRVHVNVQLIDAQADRQLWADIYDRELSAQNVFAIQDTIARSVAEALRIQLTPAEAAAIAEQPTANLEALDHYHRGRELFAQRGSTAPDTEAPRAFERAVALDPRFAPAWAGLAEARSWLIRQQLAFDTTPARQALDRAEALAPDAPETEMARGYYVYYGKGEYAAALRHFQAVHQARPSDIQAAAAIGFIQRRQGDWNGALESEQRVAGLDPRSPNPLWDIGGTYQQLRRFAAARQVLERALVLNPDYEAARVFMFFTLWGAGDTARLATFARESEGHVGEWSMGWMNRAVALAHRDYPTALRLMTTSRPATEPQRRWRLLYIALDAHAAGQTQLAAAYADSVRRLAEEDLRRLTGWRDVFGQLADAHANLGLAQALLGDTETALREGRIAAALNSVSRDAVEGPRGAGQLAAIYVLTGERDSALAQLHYLLTIPAQFGRPGMISGTAGALRLDPLCDPLRGDPRFAALLRDAVKLEREAAR